MINNQTKTDIEMLLTIARPELIKADNGGGSELFNQVSDKFGPIANRIFLALDKPQRSFQHYHDKETQRVLLDPMTVLNRASSLSDSEVTIDDPEFWCHCDMIKTLCDYLELRFCEGIVNA